ncbi:YcgL domain-containing protein [Psychrosphaera algicola]|uniref:YcgL domain-containing protein PN838_06570 n=1 Tax=Psychrosphaera algicola TaxID=3023714 RepID=A0ABT5FBQ6_9GAMM|nr:YcgL domain-containing protein [Psychrosphaera sp. G1-22]MDC2888474.1 YcgL domain-containing protein [Psychrosphaera sp. G1-22]
MQLCTVYKSSKKAETFLYVEKADDFSRVPEPLMAIMGPPTLVMTMDLDKRQKLGQADLTRVKNEIQENGFYLQIPPPQENLLETHKANMGYQEPEKN